MNPLQDWKTARAGPLGKLMYPGNILIGNGAFIMRARRICNNLREGGKALNLSKQRSRNETSDERTKLGEKHAEI